MSWLALKTRRDWLAIDSLASVYRFTPESNQPHLIFKRCVGVFCVAELDRSEPENNAYKVPFLVYDSGNSLRFPTQLVLKSYRFFPLIIYHKHPSPTSTSSKRL